MSETLEQRALRIRKEMLAEGNYSITSTYYGDEVWSEFARRLTAEQGEPVAWIYFHSRAEPQLEVQFEEPVCKKSFPDDVVWKKPLYASPSPATTDQDAVEAQRYAKFKELALADEAPYLFHGKWWYMEQEYETCDAALDAAMLNGGGSTVNRSVIYGGISMTTKADHKAAKELASAYAGYAPQHQVTPTGNLAACYLDLSAKLEAETKRKEYYRAAFGAQCGNHAHDDVPTSCVFCELEAERKAREEAERGADHLEGVWKDALRQLKAASPSTTTPDQDAVEAQRYAKFKELALADEAPYLFKWGFDSMKDLAGAMLDGEIENTEDIERLRTLAKLLRTFSKGREKKLDKIKAESERLREQFQRETLRTSKLTQLVLRYADVYSIDHYSEPWPKACHRCDLLRETKDLLETPINLDAAIDAARKGGEG